MLDGAPDPTFGMLPDEKSTWDISLDTIAVGDDRY
jgi:hypothetical protein